MRIDGDRMPVDVVGSGWQRFDDRNDKLPLVLWVSGRTCRLDESSTVVLDGQPREFRDVILGSYRFGQASPLVSASVRRKAVLALPDRPLVIVTATIPIMVRAAVPVVVTSGMRAVMPTRVPAVISIPVQLVVRTIVPPPVPIVLAGLIPAILVMGVRGLR